MKKKYIFITVISVILIVLIGGTITYQAKHFNKGISIDGVDVGGLTAEQAAKKLQQAKFTNNVYLDGKLFVQGKASSSNYNKSDNEKIKQALKDQFTVFPMHKDKNFSILKQNNQYRTSELKNAVEQKLNNENQSRKPSQDAYAELSDGQVKVINAQQGDRYNVKQMMKQYNKQLNNDSIKLKAVIDKPLSETSQKVQNEKSKLEKLANATVDYKVENQIYQLKASDMINSAKYKNGKYEIDSQNLKNKIDQINNEKATLNKKFKFKTTSGKEIEVQGKTYGWALSTNLAEKSIINAFKNGTKELNAENDIYGVGYNENGTGYGVTSNDGIGDTYAELSLSDQHAWFYKDGKLVADVDVVTGDVKTKAETPKGVYYIMYKESPSTLKGTHPDGSKYECKVTYWAQFTNDGCGFHDASWRTNWAKDAYLTEGSNGCANIKPAEMKKAYDALSVNEPVIVY